MLDSARSVVNVACLGRASSRFLLPLAALLLCPISTGASRSLRHNSKHHHHHHRHGKRHEDHSAHHRSRNPIDDAVNSAKAAAEAAGNTLERAEDAIAPEVNPARPLMSGINVMRIELCWKRDDLWSHPECMKFLGMKCTRYSTGSGVCGRFKKKLIGKCMDARSEKLKVQYCKIAKDSGFKIPSPPPPTPAPPPPVEESPEEDASGDSSDIHDVDGAEFDGDEDGADFDDVDSAADSSDVDSGVDSNDVDSGAGSSNVDSLEVEDIDSDEEGGSKNNGGTAGKSAKGGGKSGGADGAGGPDRDNDGVPDDEDAFPDDANEWADLDGDGIGDNSDDDRDGDGVPNDKDAFPRDNKEHSDRDGDGFGDNADDDVDGDGISNDKDHFPHDSSKNEQDRDGDGIPDSKDAFPDDPKEWKDSDDDGHGDNNDDYPDDPHCWKDPCSATSAHNIKPSDLDKNEDRPGGLPEQGYDELSDQWVSHDDMVTWTDDWREEWPSLPESEKESIVRICTDEPNNEWCKRYYKHQSFKR